jgi:hypothetical protein
MVKKKLNKNCAVDLKITSARNVSVEILMAQERQVEKADRHMVNKTLRAFRDANSRQH